MRLAKDIYLVGSGFSGLYLTDELDCNCYLINFDGTKILFDSGVGIHPELIEQEVLADGFSMEEISSVCLTHCHADHAGGAGYFNNRYGLKVIAPKEEALYLAKADEAFLGLKAAKKAGYYPDTYTLNPCPADRQVSAGEVLIINRSTLFLYAAKGHSIGGICYYGCINGNKFLITGDLISAEGTISLQLIPGADVQAYAKSVKQMQALKVDFLLPGHGRFLLQQGSRAVKKTALSFDHLIIPV